MTLMLWWNDDLLLCAFDLYSCHRLTIECWIQLNVVVYQIVHKSGELQEISDQFAPV